MKQTLKRIIRTVKSVKGNSLAEFATTTALMATLAATAAPKLSEMSEGAKAEKSRNELDKLVKQAGQFYQDTADIEGRGRFPGQDKYDMPVTGSGHTNSSASDHETAILADLVTNGGSFTDYRGADATDWVSVFGTSNGMAAGTKGVSDCPTCSNEWLPLFGDEVLGSRFQDGHYAYTVVAGGGSGNDVFPPVIYVVDVENAVDFNSVLEP